jgi:hypothetical protein
MKISLLGIAIHTGFSMMVALPARAQPASRAPDHAAALGRPPSSPALPGDHFDTTIRVAFLPGIKHGICHRLTSNDQLMPGCIAGESRDGEVRASCRLPLARLFYSGLCMGLVAGAHYVDEKSCAPEDTTPSQLMRVVLAYIEVRPQRMNDEFMQLVIEALRSAWPCSSPQAGDRAEEIVC